MKTKLTVRYVFSHCRLIACYTDDGYRVEVVVPEDKELPKPGDIRYIKKPITEDRTIVPDVSKGR